MDLNQRIFHRVTLTSYAIIFLVIHPVPAQLFIDFKQATGFTNDRYCYSLPDTSVQQLMLDSGSH